MTGLFHRLSFRVSVVLFFGFDQHLLQAGEDFGFQQRAFQQVECASVEGIERGREVAAIDGGDCEWRDRPQGFDVVPVVDVAALFFEAIVGVQGAERGLGELRKREKAELVRGLTGVEEHAEIGGR